VKLRPKTNHQFSKPNRSDLKNS